MRKLVLALGLALALVVPISVPAVASFLHEPHRGTECPDGFLGTLHFVANQTDGAEAGFIIAAFEQPGGGSLRVTVQSPKVNKNNMHFDVPAGAGLVLINARAYEGTTGRIIGDLDGKLVLSDYECAPDKKKT